MASRELAEAELVGTIAETKDVAVGVIDVKSYYVETPEDVAARVRRFLELAPPERLAFSTDCGLSQTARWAAKQKLANLVAGVRLVARRAVIEPFSRRRPASTQALWWLGQSGFLIGHEGRHLLVDPYLSDSLTAKYEGTETPHVRMHPRVVAPERLAFVDVVLSTHGHTDHLDGETLRAIGAPLVAPAGIVELARERSGGEVTGISRGRDDRGRQAFAIEAVPAVHHGEHCVGFVIEAGTASPLPLGRHELDRPRRPRRRRRLRPDQRQARQPRRRRRRRGSRRPSTRRSPSRATSTCSSSTRRRRTRSSANASGSASPTACCGWASGSALD